VGRGIGMGENTEYGALLMELVVEEWIRGEWLHADSGLKEHWGVF
jgi:hypothetical protein